MSRKQLRYQIGKKLFSQDSRSKTPPSFWTRLIFLNQVQKQPKQRVSVSLQDPNLDPLHRTKFQPKQTWKERKPTRLGINQNSIDGKRSIIDLWETEEK